MGTILIVEDDEVLVGMLRLVLERAGHTVHSCDNGLAGMYTVGSLKPDLIVLDLMMSLASGDVVLGFLRCTDGLKDLPVLVVSAHPDGQRIADQLGADGFLQKPVELKVFVAKVDALLASRVPN